MSKKPPKLALVIFLISAFVILGLAALVFIMLNIDQYKFVGFLSIITVSITIIIGVWLLVYFIYVRTITSIYVERKFITDPQEIDDATEIEKWKWLFFRRYNSYSLAAYFIMIIAVFLLLICIGIFVFAEKILSPNDILKGAGNEIVFIIMIRLGIGLIAYYIVQVLLRLYRYNLRIANFYMSLFDTLMIKKGFDDGFKAMFKILTPRVDVGKEPPSNPYQELVDLLKEVIKNQKANDIGQS
jgi:hypothetical protein